MTALLLEPKIAGQDIERNAMNIVNFLYANLKALTTSTNSIFGESFESGIKRIVSKAARVDAVFQRQRALITAWFPTNTDTRYQYGYNPRQNGFEGIDESLDEESPVELLVVPGLLKLGNADGEAYDKEILLVKCSVSQVVAESIRSESHSSLQRSLSRIGGSSPREDLSPDRSDRDEGGSTERKRSGSSIPTKYWKQLRKHW